jgi:hypothetical protein
MYVNNLRAFAVIAKNLDKVHPLLALVVHSSAGDDRDYDILHPVYAFKTIPIEKAMTKMMRDIETRHIDKHIHRIEIVLKNLQPLQSSDTTVSKCYNKARTSLIWEGMPRVWS